VQSVLQFFGLKLPAFAKLPKIDKEKLAKQTKAIEDRTKARDAKRRENGKQGKPA